MLRISHVFQRVPWSGLGLCLFSGIMGSCMTLWSLESRGLPEVTAQERGPGFPVQKKDGPRPGNGPDFDDFSPVKRPNLPGQDPRLNGIFNADGLTTEEVVNVRVYEKVNRSVANITTKATKPEGLFYSESTSEGAGSGSVIDRSGHILTNFHVVEEAQQVSVTLFDGKTYDAAFVGADPVYDLAVIKIEAPQTVLFPVSFGDSAALKVGMRVFAIGNPFGLERTLTTGIISSLNRSLKLHQSPLTIKSVIQIDAAINPGNSGGPLTDSHGRLIGMNTAIASSTGQSAGVGFAIPINHIGRIVPQLIERGKVLRPEIGISRVFQTDEGLLIAQLTPGGPAEKAGLRGPQLSRKRRGVFTWERVERNKADLIIAVDGQPTKTADDFLTIIEMKRPGDLVTLTIIRDTKEAQVPIRLTSSEEIATPQPPANTSPKPAPKPGPR